MDPDYLSYWRNSLDNNNNSYKFVLGLSLLKVISNGNREISYEEIRNDFVEFYWNHALIYKINHSFSQKQIPEIIQFILATTPAGYRNLSYNKVKAINKELMGQNVDFLKRKKRILRNPISRLQSDIKVIRADGDPTGKGWLYSWNEENEKIQFNPAPFDFIQGNIRPFLEFTILKGTQFLEKYNITPLLSQKVAISIQRKNIPKIIRNNFMSSTRCFYCEEEVEDEMHLDHFIPWEYILSHNVWNLVPCCPTCNNGVGGKFIKLPEKEYLSKLLSRNMHFYDSGALDKEFSSAEEVEKRVTNLYEYAMKSGYEIWDGPSEE